MQFRKMGKVRRDPKYGHVARCVVVGGDVFPRCKRYAMEFSPREPERTALLLANSANLDLLRTIAVSFVVIFHILLVFQTTPYGLMSLGYWGVLMFFVHTSVVLAASVDRLSTKPSARIYAIFLARRCFRILPLSILIVLVIATSRIPVAHLRDGTFLGIPVDSKTIISNLLLIQNLVGKDSLEAPLWTLPYEMEMYLLLPMLFWLSLRIKNSIAIVGAWLFIAFLMLFLRHTGWDFPAFVPCFLAGIVAYRLARDAKIILPYWGWPVLLGVLTIAFIIFPKHKMNWLCCLILGLAIPYFTEMPDGVLKRTCHIVSRYSYGIYLVHFMSLWLAFSYLRSRPEWERWLIFFAATASASFILYHAIEAPLIAFGKRITSSWCAGSDIYPAERVAAPDVLG